MTPPSSAAVLAVIYTLIGICTAVLIARIYLRLKIEKAGLLLNDYSMILAWCSAVTCSFFDVIYELEGILRPDLDYTLVGLDAGPKKLEFLFKIMWAGNIPWFTTFYLCKATLLIVYYKLFPPYMVKRRIALWATMCYCAAAYVVSMCLLFFLCFPIKRNWDLSQPEKLCGGDTVATIFQIAWSLHIFGSIFIFILPWLVLYELDMRARTRYSVYGIFLIGVIDISMSITRFMTIQFGNDGEFRAITMVELWSALDEYIGLLVCFLPSLSPYLKPKAVSSFESLPSNLPPTSSATNDPEQFRSTGAAKTPQVVENSDGQRHGSVAVVIENSSDGYDKM